MEMLQGSSTGKERGGRGKEMVVCEAWKSLKVAVQEGARRKRRTSKKHVNILKTVGTSERHFLRMQSCWPARALQTISSLRLCRKTGAERFSHGFKRLGQGTCMGTSSLLEGFAFCMVFCASMLAFPSLRSEANYTRTQAWDISEST